MDTKVQDTTAVAPLDLNRATYEELETLPYIGEVLARRILEYREAQGGFSSVEELQNVQGIHMAAYEGLRELLTVTPPEVEPVDGSSPEEESVQPERGEEPGGEAVAPEVSPSTAPVRQTHSWAWLWGALLGGFLGMIFSLLVWAGINGSLDVGDSYGMRHLKQQVEDVSARVTALQTQMDTLQQQVSSLEDMAGRVERLETSSAALEQEVRLVVSKVASLDGDLAGLSDDVGGLAEQVTTVQKQSRQTADFFAGLRDLLNQAFGTPQPLASPVALPLLNGGGSK